MSKMKRKWVDLDWASPDALRAQDIPYSETKSVAEAIDDARKTVRVSVTDTTVSNLSDKIVAGTNAIATVVQYQGGAEKLEIGFSGNISQDTKMEYEEITLLEDDITNKYVLLTYEPSDPENVIVSIPNGPIQNHGIDFEMDETDLSKLKWVGLGLDGNLMIGDTLCIIYPRLETEGTGIIFTTKAVSMAYNAKAHEKILCDTSTSGFIVTLPNAPNLGAEIWFVDAAGTFDTNNLTINGNGQKIMGSTNDFVADVQYAAFGLIYHGTTHGWRLIDG